MSSSLALTALLMGLVGGPHCVAMCGAACAVLARATCGGKPEQVVWFQGVAPASMPVPSVPSPLLLSSSLAAELPRLLLFQVGRMLGYAVLGGVVAASMQGLGWLTIHSAALRPLWSLLHVAAIALGLVLLWRAAQPVWLEQGAQRLWRRVQAVVQPSGGGAGRVVLLMIGALWALLPCGLLYSALLVAALTGQAWQGAIVMALFALGTAVSMTLGPWLWLRLSRDLRPGRGSGMQTLGVRLAGLTLALSSAWALWMGLVHDAAPWCATV